MMWPAHPVAMDAGTGKGWKLCGVRDLPQLFSGRKVLSLLKILFTNECVFDCHYCVNRCSNDVPRAAFTPDEVCRLTMEFTAETISKACF